MRTDLSNSVWVKVCGLTNRRDAELAIDAGADALGFNLWEGSKRFVDPWKNAGWITELDPKAERVAVLVNAPIEEALRIADLPAFNSLQFHGDEPEAYLAEFSRRKVPFIVARRLSAPMPDLGMLALADRILIDAAVSGSYGGTGVLLDQDLAADFVRMHRPHQVVLAGGLNPHNVAEAVRRVRPFGVDVASGVEMNPRQKDEAKVRAFVDAARVGNT